MKFPFMLYFLCPCYIACHYYFVIHNDDPVSYSFCVLAIYDEDTMSY